MSTATADKPARSSSAHGEPHPRLTLDDLRDPAKFKTLHAIPLIDEHQDKIKGDIDADKLHLISKNSNDRGAAGNMAAVTLGHTKRKQTIVIIKPDGSRVILPGVDEQNQPPVIGFASNFHVAPINGKQFMHGDLHIYPEHASKLKEYPFRSIERLTPPEDSEDDGEDNSFHYTDRISLLKTPPERDGGIIAYEKMPRPGDDCDCSDPANSLNPRCLLRVAYARDLPPITAYEADDPAASAGADCPCHDSSTRTNYSEEPAMPEVPKPPAAPPPEAAAPPPPEAPPPEMAPAAPPAGTLGSMTIDQLIAAITPGIHDAVMNSLMTLMPPADEGADANQDGIPDDEEDADRDGVPDDEESPVAVTSPAKQYEADEEGGVPIAAQATVAEAAPAQLDKEEVGEEAGERQKYQASEPGAGNVFIPGGTATACNGNGSPKKPKESRMEKTVYDRKEVEDLKALLATIDGERKKYEKDLAETQEVILMLVEDRNNAQLYAKRNQFKDELQAVMADGYEVDIEDELAAITLETPAEYNATRIGKIRRLHARSAANVRHTIPIGGVTPSGGNNGRPAGIATPEQAYEAANYSVANGCSIPEAKRALGYG